MLVWAELQQYIAVSRGSTDTARAPLNGLYQELRALPTNARSTVLQNKLAPTDLHPPLTILYTHQLYSPFSHTLLSPLCPAPPEAA